MIIGRVLDAKGVPQLVKQLDEQTVQPIAGNLFGTTWNVGEPVSIKDLRFLPPVYPSKVIGIGSNYRLHIAEMGRSEPTEPKVFLKPNSAVIGNGDAIQIPPGTERVDHEAELGVVIGRHAYCISEEESLDCVLGYTIVNDVTARDFQAKDGVFTRAKGFDTFCPMGPWLHIVERADLESPRRIQCWVDGQLRQDSMTSDMLFSIPKIISFVSHIMSLHPGDVIATGTPSGVGPLVDGNVVEIEIEGLGRLRNPVVNREDRCRLNS